MAITALKGSTGFEVGHVSMFDVADRSTADTDYVNVSTAANHTGAYGLRVRNTSGAVSWAQRAVDTTPAEIYLGVWCNPEEVEGGYTPWGYGYIQIVVGGSVVVELRNDSSRYWDAYVNSVKVADGTIQANDGWHFVELHVLVDNSGTIQTRINGTEDIDYSGDTQPGAGTAITHVRFACGYPAPPHTCAWQYDDFTVGTGDWPGDIRYTVLAPNADTAQKDWTPSAGSLNYDMIDEIPPNDADYVSTGSMNYKDLYDVEDWAYGGTYTPQFIVPWVRSKKDTASVQGIAQIIDSGGTEDSGGSFALTTDWAYYSRVVLLDPDGDVAWTASALNNIKTGQEAFV